MEQRISPWMFQRTDNMGLMLKIMRWQDRPDLAEWTPDEDPTVYVLADLWCNYFGNNTYQGDAQWTPPKWAVDEYINSIPWGQPGYFDDAGGDHHIFGAAKALNGKLKAGHTIVFGSQGVNKAQFYDPTAWENRVAKASGFANVVLYGAKSDTDRGSTYYPDKGERGPWAWWPFGLSDVVYGGGMPYQQHVSTFAVWQEVERNAAADPGTGTIPNSPEVLAELAALRAAVEAAAKAGKGIEAALTELVAYIKGNAA